MLTSLATNLPPHVGMVTMEEIKEGAVVNPTFTLWDSEAQGLMDQLWSLSLRPTQGKQSEGQAAAVERHLDDMRLIAFDSLGIKLEEHRGK